MVDRVFGPSVSPGIPISAGSTVKFRVRQASGSAQTLSNVRFGIMQVEPQGQGLVALPSTGGATPGEEWLPVEGPLLVIGDGDGQVRKYNTSTGTVWLEGVGDTGNVIDQAFFAPSGNVLGASNNRMRMFDSDGVGLWDYNAGSASIIHVAMRKDGYVAVTLAGPNSTVLLDADGSEVWTYMGHSEFQRRLIFDENNNIYTSTTSTFSPAVDKIDPDGVGGRLYTSDAGTATSYMVQTDQNGNIYASGGNNEVHAIDAAGDLLYKHAINSGSSRAHGGSVDLAHVYIGDIAGGLTKLTHGGDLVWRVETSLGNLYGVAVTPDGDVYVGGSSSSGVKRYDADGTETGSWGSLSSRSWGLDVQPGILNHYL